MGKNVKKRVTIRPRRIQVERADFTDLQGPRVTAEMVRRMLTQEGPRTISYMHRRVKRHYKEIGYPHRAPTYASFHVFVKTLETAGLVRAGEQGAKVPRVGLDVNYRYWELVPENAASPDWQNATAARRRIQAARA